MSTVRLQIIEAIKDALAAETGLVIYRNLDYAIEARNTPAIALQSEDDAPSDDGRVDALSQECRFDVVVLVANVVDPEAAADPFEAQIHAVLLANATFGGHAVAVRRVGASWLFDLGESVQRTLRYSVSYASAHNDLETAA